MTTTTILLIMLSLVVAGSLSFCHYLYKAKNNSTVSLFLAFLRFMSIFGILLLLINPIITKNTLDTVKTPLPIVVDNSNSISFLNVNEKASQLYQKIKEFDKEYIISSCGFEAYAFLIFQRHSIFLLFLIFIFSKHLLFY